MDNKAYTKSSKWYDFIYLSKANEMYDGTINDFYYNSQEILGRLPETVLDLGCGTGNHAVTLTRQGIMVTGLDLSEHQLEVARNKAQTENLEIDFIQGDLAGLPTFDHSFEAIAGFFSGFCYLLKDDDVIAFLNKSFELAAEKSFLYFEFWNVLAILPGSHHVYEVENEGIRLIRHNTTELDLETGIATMPMKHLITQDDKILDEFTETHELRCYTIPQLKQLVSQSPWNLQKIYSYDSDFSQKDPERNDFRYFAILTKGV